MHIEKQKTYHGIIIFGEMASGKDTLADYLLKVNDKCCKYNIGNAVRQFLSIIKVNPEFKGKNRILGQSIADKLREVHPDILNDYCLSLIYEKWEKPLKFNITNINDNLDFHTDLFRKLALVIENEIPLVVGGRTYQDYDYWYNKNFLTVGIICDFKRRYDRLCKRDGLEVAQNSNFKHNTEIDVGDIVKNKCEYVINNDGNFNQLYEQADHLLKKFLSKE
jgi:dephospho-CoA kinase